MIARGYDKELGDGTMANEDDVWNRDTPDQEHGQCGVVWFRRESGVAMCTAATSEHRSTRSIN
jgi:hypothetical protein